MPMVVLARLRAIHVERPACQAPPAAPLSTLCGLAFSSRCSLGTAGELGRARFDLVLMQVVHPEELELPLAAVARFVGTEGEPGRFDGEPDALADRYRERFQRHVRTIRAGAKTRGCSWHLARCDEDPYVFLKHCFL